MSERAVVVGGGISGLAAARSLALRGYSVTLIEAQDQPGGLASGVEIDGQPIERSYHYLVPGEQDILALLDELSLSDRVEWFQSSIGILTGGKVWPTTSPLDLLRFRPLRLLDRVRAGIGALRLGRVRDWETLDTTTAHDWLTALTSPAVTEVVWDPLLRAKFGPAAADVPAAWMWGRLEQRYKARRGGGEAIGYLRGGFGQFFAALVDDLRRRGVDVRMGQPVQRLLLQDGRIHGVDLGGEQLPADVVLFTGPLPQLPPLLPAELVDHRWSSARGVGAVCVVLALPYALTDQFWTNVCDPDVPFGGIIEHTNLVPARWYGGQHVVYLSRYFVENEDVATADPNEQAKEWLTALEALFPHFSAADVSSLQASRTSYAAPLVTTPYLPLVAPVRSPIPGLHLATTAQIYPQDRGLSEGIRRATMAVSVIDNTAWQCPACESLDGSDAYGIAATGVDPGSFRPSSSAYGQTAAAAVRCARCGHASLQTAARPEGVVAAYAEAVDEVSLREESGQVETARRALDEIERLVRPGRVVDVGCWTGSFLVAARSRGWAPIGVEPSRWASARARERSLTVYTRELGAAVELLDPEAFRLVVCCDVLEHLADPGAALDVMHHLLEPGGMLYLTVPDADSRLARAMGRHWWAIVPMHVQYFTRHSLRRVLENHGFSVRFVASHPKVFSLRYYAERLDTFLPLRGRLAEAAAERSGFGDRLVAPNLGDRVQVIAERQ